MASTWIEPGTFDLPPMTFPDTFEAIARALQVGGDDSAPSSSGTPSPPFRHSISGKTTPVGPTGKVGKRKPRTSRRAPVTYIEADPANFRAMVQMITGVPVAAKGEGELENMKVERQRQRHRPRETAATTTPVGFLPTLDTSAYLLDRSAEVATCGGVEDDFDLDGLPTLDSWGSFDNLGF